MMQREKTFKEKMELAYRKTAEKKFFMRSMVLFSLQLVLWFHFFWFMLIGGWKKYAFTSFLLVNILVVSSFAYPVFGDREVVVLPETVAEALMAAESTIQLMSDDDAPFPDEFYDDENEGNSGHHDLDDYDSYSLDEILAERDMAENGENGIKAEETDPSEALAQDELGNVQFSADDWRLVLVNKQHPIPDDYDYTLGIIKGYMQCDERIIDALLLMMQQAQNEGVELVIRSPHRDLDHQEQLFTRKINSYMRSGLSYLEAYKQTAHTVTVPGTSEHEIGLALDITSKDHKALDAGFADTEAGRWLADYSYEYGFVVRYPLGKEYITGIEFEPWHFRYVGREAAKIMKEEGIVLEEFVEKYTG